MSDAIFYDPQRRRWKRLRRLFDAVAVATTIVVVFFSVMVFRQEHLPNLLLPDQKRQYKGLKEKERRRAKPRQARLRMKGKKPSQVVLNSGEGIRAAFYVTWDAASYSSLRQYVHHIDLLYPEWLHVLTPDGKLSGFTSENVRFPVVDNGRVRSVDDPEKPVMKLIRDENADTEVFPLINNFDPLEGDHGEWMPQIGAVLDNPDARKTMRSELVAFLSSGKFKGLTLDFEEVPTKSQPGYRALISELASDLHASGLKLYVCVPTRNEDFDYRYIANNSDGVILMNYDEHFPDGKPGAVASQDWFTENVQRALQTMPANKLIVAIANYGYDWTIDGKTHKVLGAQNRTVQEALLAARDSEADVEFDADSLNPHFGYLDGNQRHELWFTDAVTALNQMRAARKLGINTFALWRLGSEDRSMWNIFDQPGKPDAITTLNGTVAPGYDVDMEGNGEILRVGNRPAAGQRRVEVDPSTGLISQETYTTLPTPYELDEYGARDKQVAITFDDGPDPTWTPKMLDVLKREHATATFFIIGSEAEKFPALVKRIYREGNEIGNHTWTHPDISDVRSRYMELELNLTERFFASTIGVKPLLFRPPYSIDQEPDTGDQVRPLELAQQMGYITVGDKLDPNDWKKDPRPTPQQITDAVLNHLPPCTGMDLRCGNIILLHDGGGDRSHTVAALPMIIEGLRARGYEIVPVSQLMGKTRADVMPPISANERWSARLTQLGFWGYAFIYGGIVLIFFIGDVLMSMRLVLVGVFAIYDRLRDKEKADAFSHLDYKPPVAVLVPAYNEEKVIVHTVRSVLHSHYPKLRVIIIDDGSTDKTVQVVQDAFASEIASGKVLLLTKPNGGKAAALNEGLKYVDEEIFVGIDADTIVAPSAIAHLVPNFADPKIGAIAGNAKVGNRVNLWTRWQALEYITSQNFERRALDVFGAVTVVPGAIGAWRTSAVREEGGYHTDTVAEDADLTMRLLRAGYRVEYEDRALAFTEAPHKASGLMRQRFRWSYGIMQSAWKHRSVFLREGVLGFVALPNILIFQIMLPLVSPLIDLLFVFGVLDYAVDKYFHPDTANPANLQKLAVFFFAFLVIDFIASAIAFALERRGADRRENGWLLAHVWLQRFAYRQLFSVVLIKTLKRVLDGKRFGWDKLERTASVEYGREAGVGKG